MAIKAIIFDIDGVLADSRSAVVSNTKTLLAEYGFPVEDGRVGRMSSAHSAESVLLALAPSLEKSPVLLRRMLRRLSEITRKNLHLVKPTPLASRLPEIAGKYLLAAASNRKASAAMVLAKLGIAKHFSAVVTSADAPPKPNPGMITLALGKMGVRPEEAIFVGDNREDMEAGKSAGVETVMLDGMKEEECRKFLERIGC